MSMNLYFAELLWNNFCQKTMKKTDSSRECSVILAMFNTKKKKGHFIIPFILIALREFCIFPSSNKKGPHKAFHFQAELQRFRCWPKKYWSCQMKQVPVSMPLWIKTYQYELLLCWLYSSLIPELNKKIDFFVISSFLLTEFMHMFYIWYCLYPQIQSRI